MYQKVEKHSPDEPDKYFVVRTKDSYEYAQNMLFPRMYDSGHAQAYEDWMGGIEGNVSDYDRCGQIVSVKMPTFIENIRFFLSYQCNFMYWRYFMWNFAGRQNDIQGNGELEHGNWITGFSFLDEMMLGNQELLPDELKENKGHNVFYCMPLLLGLLGLFWQAYKGKKGIQQFWVVFFLFFMTGLLPLSSTSTRHLCSPVSVTMPMPVRSMLMLYGAVWVLLPSSTSLRGSFSGIRRMWLLPPLLA